MRGYLVCCQAILLLAVCTGPVRADWSYGTDFSWPHAEPEFPWANEVGRWEAVDGRYSARSPSNSPPTYSSYHADVIDFYVEVDIVDLQDGGLWLRSADNRNGVLLVTGGRGGQGTGLYWHFVEDGVAGPALNEVTGLFEPGASDVHVRVEVRGDDYRAYVGDELAPSTTLTTHRFSHGKVALYDNSAQSFDFFRLTLICGEGIPGDIDFNGKVDLYDFGILKERFGIIGNGAGDLNCDGRVDLSDFGILKEHFGQFQGVQAPEPTGWSLWLVAMACCAGRRLVRRPGRRVLGPKL